MSEVPKAPAGYDDELRRLDESMCKILGERFAATRDRAGFPEKDQIESWAVRFNINDIYLKGVFGALQTAEYFKERVEPAGYIKQIPVMKGIEVDEAFYSVTTIRQFKNASELVLHVDRHWTTDKEAVREKPVHLELDVGDGFATWQRGGSGSGAHFAYTFVVTPALPDEPSELTLVFREYKQPFRNEPTGLAIVIRPEE